MLAWRRELADRALTLASLTCLCALLIAGCASTLAGGTSPQSTATATAQPTATLAPTATPGVICSEAAADRVDAVAPNIPLPPHTESLRQPGAAGAGFYLECTPGASQSAITSYLNAAMPNAGWRAWTPATDDAGGCGGQSNNFWKWQKGGTAMGWSFPTMMPPFHWMLAFCSLAFATPQA